MSRYNQRVRQSISDLYVMYSKMKSQYIQRLGEIQMKLQNQNGKLLYNDYIALVETEHRIKESIKELDIRIDTTDIAREICLNIADEEENIK